MKRYIFSIAAILLAIGTFSFTTLKSPSTNSFFEFDSFHYTPTLTNVQDESKWIKVADIGTCNNIQVKACRIEVMPTYVSGSSLLPTATITAQESSKDISYVVAGNIVTIRNKN